MERVQASTNSIAADFADERKYYKIVVFPEAGKMGFTVMLKNAKTIDDEKQFFRIATAQKYADAHFPDAYSVMIRLEQYRGRISSPYSERIAGVWANI